jgi:hypothetical protein
MSGAGLSCDGLRYSWIRPGTNDSALRNTTNTSHLSPRRKPADIRSLFSFLRFPHFFYRHSLGYLASSVVGRFLLFHFTFSRSQLEQWF